MIKATCDRDREATDNTYMYKNSFLTKQCDKVWNSHTGCSNQTVVNRKMMESENVVGYEKLHVDIQLSGFSQRLT